MQQQGLFPPSETRQHDVPSVLYGNNFFELVMFRLWILPDWYTLRALFSLSARRTSRYSVMYGFKNDCINPSINIYDTFFVFHLCVLLDGVVLLFSPVWPKQPHHGGILIPLAGYYWLMCRCEDMLGKSGAVFLAETPQSITVCRWDVETAKQITGD